MFTAVISNEARHTENMGAGSAGHMGAENAGAGGYLAAMLKRSQDMLREAERIIAHQEKRIQSLEALAVTDALTGLMKRPAFETALEQEVSRISQSHSEGAVLMLIDLDRFKGVNNAFGAAAGDVCLETLAEKLKGLIRLTDAAARLDGDVFALLFTQATLEKIGPRLEKIRGELSAMHFYWNGARVLFSASTGFSALGEGTVAAQAFVAAEEDLYRQKAARKQ